MKFGRGLGAGKEDIFSVGCFGQAPSRRGMVGVNMRVDDIEDAHPRVFRGLKIGRDIADRVDDGRRGLAAAAEKVGNAYGIGVQELPEDHDRLPPSLEPGRLPGPPRWRLTNHAALIQLLC